jgi:hypothetical protein
MGAYTSAPIIARSHEMSSTTPTTFSAWPAISIDRPNAAVLPKKRFLVETLMTATARAFRSSSSVNGEPSRNRMSRIDQNAASTRFSRDLTF